MKLKNEKLVEYTIEKNRCIAYFKKSPVVAAAIIAFASIRKISSHAERFGHGPIA